MNNYELKQGLLDRLEIEQLVSKIQRLEKENAELTFKLKPFLIEQQKREDYLNKRDEIDLKISQMLYNFHNK